MEAFTVPGMKEKKATGRPSKHTHETRIMIGRKVVNREFSYSQAAEAFGISEGAIGTCVKLFKNQGVNQRRTERAKERTAEFTDFQHQSQVKELKQQIGELYIENQMLKKILTRFQQAKKESGSKIISSSSVASQEAAE